MTSDDGTAQSSPTEDLLDVLDLRPVGEARSSSVIDAPDNAPEMDLSERRLQLFTGRSQVTPHGRAFGGQVLAQSVIAAGRTVASAGLTSRAIHSLHAYFIRPGDSEHTIEFGVENLRDGNSFSVRRVYAMQYGKTILSATLSFQEVEEKPMIGGT